MGRAARHGPCRGRAAFLPLGGGRAPALLRGTSPRRAGTRSALPVWIVGLAVAALCACVGPALGGRPPSRPGGDEGMVVYAVGRLSFEAPAAWDARGDSRHVVVQPADERALLDVRLLDRPFGGEAACLRDAEDALARGSGEFRNVRRHPTTFAGRRAVTQEADQGPWHGWAYAICDGRVQYRVFFSGRSPLPDEDVTAWRLLIASARMEGPP